MCIDGKRSTDKRGRKSFGDTLCERSGGRAALKRSTVLEDWNQDKGGSVLAAQRQQWQ